MFVLVLVSLGTGCGSRATPPPEPQTIQFVIYDYPNEQIAPYQRLADEFHTAHPELTIAIQPVSGSSSLRSAVEAGADVVLSWGWALGDVGELRPLDPFIETEPASFLDDYLPQAVKTIRYQGQVVALPADLDTLVLYYNKDLFNAVGITAPPKTWDEFIAATEKITKINAIGEIVPSGAAMGTAFNINRSTDILGVLMMQNGTKMRDTNERVSFGNDASAKKALEFYTDFSRNSAPNYSWNPQMHYSVDAFSEGTLAMMLNYSWQEGVIRGKSPKLNFSVSELPQLNLGAPVNYANYWGYAVSSNKIIKADPKSKLAPVSNTLRVTEAWKFLTYLTTRAETPVAVSTPATSAVKKPAGKFDPAENYLEKTKQPAARRDLIDKQKDDLDLGVFASSNLVAKSWKQNDPLAIESILGEMIGNVNRGAASVADALKTAEGRIQKLEMK